MTDYVKSTSFASKDALSTGNPLKIVKGTEIDTEFNNIAVAVATKADLLNPTFTGVPAAPTASFGTASTQLATTAFVSAAMIAAYPVGSIYMNAAVATNPATLLGFGTWVAFGAGRVPVGFNSADSLFDTVEETGGAQTVAAAGSVSMTTGGTSLTEAQMPRHYHQMRGPNSLTAPQNDQGWGSFGNYGGGTPDDDAQQYGTFSTGSGASSGGTATGTAVGDAHTHSVSGSLTGSATSVLQPYIVVHMWKRTA